MPRERSAAANFVGDTPLYVAASSSESVSPRYSVNAVVRDLCDIFVYTDTNAAQVLNYFVYLQSNQSD